MSEATWRVHRCPRCHEAFRRREHLELHTGRRHGGNLSVAEAEAFSAALAHEEKQLAKVRVHVKAGFAVLPIFLFLVFSAIALTSTGASAGFLLLVIPGFLVFGGLVYAMVVSRAEYERVEAEKRAAAHEAAEHEERGQEEKGP